MCGLTNKIQHHRKRKKKHMIEVTLTNEQKVKVTLTPKTATGKASQVQGGSVKFTVQSGDSTVVPSPDGLSADLISSDTPGDTQILVEADADVGDGVETISDIITLHVAGAHAANLGLAVGTPESK